MNATSPQRLRTLVAIAILCVGIIVATATFVAAQQGSDGKDPAAGGGPRPATATSEVPTETTGAIDEARDTHLSTSPLSDIDAAISGGSAEPVLAAWQRATVSCFVGSDRTGAWCEGLPGEPGTEHEVEVVEMIDVQLSLSQAEQLLEKVLEGNAGDLVFVAHSMNPGQLILGYDIPPVADGGETREYLWVEVDAGASEPIVRFAPLTQTPLDEWRNYDRPTSELIAVDPSLEDGQT